MDTGLYCITLLLDWTVLLVDSFYIGLHYLDSGLDSITYGFWIGMDCVTSGFWIGLHYFLVLDWIALLMDSGLHCMALLLDWIVLLLDSG